MPRTTLVNRAFSRLLVLTWAVTAASASTAYLPVYSVPGHTPGTGGYSGDLTGLTGAGNGIAAAGVDAFRPDDGYSIPDNVAVRWSPSDHTELGSLGGDTYLGAMLPDGAAVGSAYKPSATPGVFFERPVRWSPDGSVTELALLDSSEPQFTRSYAVALNAQGVVIGGQSKVTPPPSGFVYDIRAVRWNAAGEPTELAWLGMNSEGQGVAYARAINEAGVAVGQSKTFSPASVDLGGRAVRWNDQGAVTELDTPTVSTDGSGNAEAVAINDSGIIVGHAAKFDGAGQPIGRQAVRWNTSSPAAEVLAGLDAGNDYYTLALDINQDGVVIGSSEKLNAIGSRAVRWDAGSTVAFELPSPNNHSSSRFHTAAWDINNVGLIAGAWSDINISDHYQGTFAVVWGADGIAIDLNALIDPDSGWRLIHAYSITDTNWVAGQGMFDPDGPGGVEAYARPWLMQIPEPATWSMTILALAGWMIRRRPAAR